MGYVDGTLVCPPKHVAGLTTVNPAYTTWVQQDQMILSWINGSLNASVLSVVASKRTARATWEALEQRYASTSQNRILFLRNELLQTKKGDLSVADYLDRINVIADNLALAGQPVSDDDLVQIVLNNLGPAYEMTVSAAQARDNPITYPALESLLLTTERRMVEHNVPLVEGATVNAFMASRGRGGGRSRGGGRGNYSHRGGAQRGPNPRHYNASQNNQGTGERFVSCGNNPRQVAHLIQKLGSLFQMKDLGPLSYFLGIEVKYNSDAMHLCQSKYALDLLTRTKFTDAKPISTPVSSGQKLSAHIGDPYGKPDMYRSVVGALQYLTITRPDLSYAVNQVCQFMHSPKNTHWMAVKRILRYLKATYNHGLLELLRGFCVYLGSNLVSWSSKKQKTVSRSSAEAEYRQLAYTAAELSWLRSLYKDLHLTLTSLLTFLLKASLLHDLSFLSPSFQLFPHLFACGGLLTQVNLPFHPIHDLMLHMQCRIPVTSMGVCTCHHPLCFTDWRHIPTLRMYDYA
ncbi:hypothetical protein D8674_013446 [Pyrus ussuriensis x Pyrus communis]|uniref:Reverse transcriptase Ty1/copia-type domain-containing protein n=1 Tax=Pyrus ussuriensis x Pyrus communis TaxID=2448454 RepID=A0A5N5GR21_9ROSA|nr:hypothetical protein D8674_013446 [Pyrus ussuriensis x Pyrus communis]